MAIAPNFGWRITAAAGNSMSPTLKSGGMVVIRPVDSNEIELGDIIAYERNDKLIVHRVVVIDEDYDGSLIFTTRGDSNLEIDRSVHSNQIVGRLYLYVPIVGHPFVFLSSPLGLTLFLLVVGLILVLVYKRTRQSRS